MNIEKTFSVIYCFCAAVMFYQMSTITPGDAIRFYSLASNVLLFVIIANFGYGYWKKLFNFQRVPSQRKAVLITGCDSGFGHGLAKKLDGQGYHVFAGCYFPEGKGANTLKEVCSSRLRVIAIDVTKEESISGAFDYVKSHLGKLEFWALVNNAGIPGVGDVIFGKKTLFEDCFAVNSVGPIRMTKKFLPLLIKSKGRVVNVSSLGGRLVSLYTAPYTMSKFSAVAFTESSRQELEQHGIRSVSIEPEFFNTPMLQRSTELIKDMHQNVEKDVRALYSKSYFNNAVRVSATVPYISTDISPVLDALYNAVSLDAPQDSYQPCRGLFLEAVISIPKVLPSSFISMAILLGSNLLGFIH